MVVAELPPRPPGMGEATPAGPAGPPPVSLLAAPPRVASYRLVVGAVLVVVGAVLVWVATMVLDQEGGLSRWICGLVGVACVFRGLDIAAKARFGARFQTGLYLAGIWIALVVAVALLAPLLPLQHPGYLPLSTPSYLRPDLFHAYPLGTDGNGRDVLSRLVYGARVSLLIGVGSTVIGMSVGMFLGVLAAYYGGVTDAVVRIVADTVLAFPPLVFLLALVAVLRPSLTTLFVAFSVLTIPTLIRLSRATALRLAEREFVVAARGLGAKGRRIMGRELVPGVFRVLAPYAMVIVASLIVAEASLSFLGLGIQAPAPSWGNMIAGADDVLQQDPQGVVIPAIALFLTVVSFNRLGEGARRRADTRGSVLA